MLTCTVEKNLLNNHYFKEVNHEDYLYWAELNSLKKNIKIEHINQILAVYNISRNSISSNKFSSLNGITIVIEIRL